MIRSASPCPAVAISPTTAPVRVTSVLIPAVVPWATRVAWPSRPAQSRPMVSAAAETASKKPTESASGVVATLPVQYAPSEPITAQSVKVPPMSTPTLNPPSGSASRIAIGLPRVVGLFRVVAVPGGHRDIEVLAHRSGR
jgi:hypothetical protein